MTLLFIDDDPEDTELFCEAVTYLNNSDFIYAEKESVACVTANNGCMAIDLLAALKEMPDYIFLDINMPGMDGRQCLRHLKSDQLFCDIPVIMLSTTFDGQDAIALKALGAYDCIKKPCAFNDLVKVLSKYIYRKYS